jgi:hypothetical protein
MINLEDLLKKEPTLTALGIETRFTGHTDRLPDIAEVEKCVDWLNSKKLVPTKTVSFNSSSIKVWVELEMKTYIAGGAAVAAVIYLGIPYKKIPDSATVEVFLLKKEIFSR